MSTEPTQVFKPSIRAYAKNTLLVGGLAVPVLVALVLTNRDKATLLLIVIIAFVGSVGGVLLYIAWARIYVTSDAIGKRGFGPTKWVTRTSISRGLLVRRLSAGTSPPAHLFLFAPDSALVFRLYGAIWGEPQLQAIGSALGIEVTVRSSIEAAELNRIEPTALTWAETHPKALTGVVLGVFALIAVVVTIIVYQTR